MRMRTSVILVAAAVAAAALAIAGPVSGAAGCGAAVINAWHNARLDASYAPACYRQALQELPEDIRIYSSAEDDISRALIASLAKRSAATRATQGGAVRGVVRKLASASSSKAVRKEAAAAAAGPSANTVPLTVIVSAAGALMLVGSAAISVAARRLRRGKAT